MQPNVVQSPQVSTAQTSIVQPQQNTTLPTNDQTETQSPSQESFSVCIKTYDLLSYLGINVYVTG